MLITTREMAKELRCSQPTLLRLVREGKVPVLRVGRDFRFDAVAVKKALTDDPIGNGGDAD
jgi:excisionase family DNA binding protein